MLRRPFWALALKCRFGVTNGVTNGLYVDNCVYCCVRNLNSTSGDFHVKSTKCSYSTSVIAKEQNDVSISDLLKAHSESQKRAHVFREPQTRSTVETFSDVLWSFDRRKGKKPSEPEVVLKSTFDDVVSLSENLKADTIKIDIADIQKLGQFLYWNPTQIRKAVKMLKSIEKNFSQIPQSSHFRISLQPEITECKDLVIDRVCANRCAKIFKELISDSETIVNLFEDADLDKFKHFVYQFDQLELDEDFSIHNLSVLIDKFHNLVNQESSFVNPSPHMIQLIEKSTLNERVSLLDYLAKISCRSLTLISAICASFLSPIAETGLDHREEKRLARPKLRSICYSLSMLNYYDENLLNRAAEAFLYDLNETDSITPQMATSFLTLCRKMHFKSDPIIQGVANAMVPLMVRLREDNSMDIQKTQDRKCFAEFINCLASFNVSLDDLSVSPETGRNLSENFTLKNLISDCVTKQCDSSENLTFFKSLVLLNMLTEEHFQTVRPHIEAAFKITEDDLDGASDTFAQYQRFCAQMILAEGCLSRLPSALNLRLVLNESVEDLAAVKQSEVVLSDAHVHARQFFEEAADKLGLEFVPSAHVGLGYIADAILLPKTLWNEIDAKQIVVDCPSLYDSVNMFEEFRGEKLKQLRHLKQLNCLLFVVDPLHWSQLQDSHEKMQYLEAKFNIELENILKPHFKSFQFKSL